MPVEEERVDDSPSLIFRLNDDGEGPELLKEVCTDWFLRLQV